MEIHQGLLLSLKCRVKGDSNPDIRWFKDGIPIRSNQKANINIRVSVRQSQLRVSNMQMSDSGNYSCIGESTTNQMSRWVYVSVLPTPDERKVADEKAYSPCPVNMCHTGRCILIDGQPTCRCPTSHTGSDCSQRVLDEARLSSASPQSTERRLVEDDFILDQTVPNAGNAATNRGVPAGSMADYCHLPKYSSSPECVTTNSYLYTFIGTAIACSVIILLLGSFLGYIRRRKILNRQRRTNCDAQLGTANETNDTIQDSQMRVPLDTQLTKGRAESPLFTHIPSVSTSTYNCAVAVRGMPRRSPGLVDTMDQTNTVPNSAYVVFTSTTPLALHPITDLMLSGEKRNGSQSTHLLPSPSEPRSIALVHDLNGSGHVPQIPGTMSSPRHFDPGGWPPKESSLLLKPVSTTGCSTMLPSSNAKQIYVQIPRLTAPVYLSGASHPMPVTSTIISDDVPLTTNDSQQWIQRPIDMTQSKDSIAMTSMASSPLTSTLLFTKLPQFTPDCVPTLREDGDKVCDQTAPRRTRLVTFQPMPGTIR